MCLPEASHKGRPCGEFGQPEIQNLRLATLRYEDVRRLDVAVHDALRMSRVQCIGNLDSQVKKRFHS